LLYTKAPVVSVKVRFDVWGYYSVLAGSTYQHAMLRVDIEDAMEIVHDFYT
jgi:hypothetical protein